jgi:hypothetical protein
MQRMSNTCSTRGSLQKYFLLKDVQVVKDIRLCRANVQQLQLCRPQQRSAKVSYFRCDYVTINTIDSIEKCGKTCSWPWGWRFAPKAFARTLRCHQKQPSAAACP